MEGPIEPPQKMIGQTFQKNRMHFVIKLIMTTWFRDTRDRKTLEKRREDWIKDLNMNLLKAKVARATHFFD